MKTLKSTLLALLVVSVFSCSKDDDSPNPGNQAPESFNLITVPDGSNNVDLKPTFSWEPAIDPDGDAVSYDVYLDTENPPTTALASGLSDITYTPQDNLNPGETYYWAVMAKDGNQGETLSNVASFATKEEIAPIVLDCYYFDDNPNAVLQDNPETPVDYIITCMTPIDGKLTVEPGVVIAFEQNAGMNFGEQSSFKMEGTAAKPIVLTGVEETKGFWAGAITYSTNTDNKMSYVTIDYAGGDPLPGHGQTAALAVYGTNVPITLDHCTLSNSASKGMSVAAASQIGKDVQNVFMTNCTITKNDLPIKSTAGRLRMYNGTNSFSGNTNDYVYLKGGTLFGDATWAKLDVPYLLENDFRRGFKINDGVLTVEPGTDIIMTAGSGMQLKEEAALVMVGTAEDPIIVRGEQDVAGYWNSILIDSPSPLNEIGHVNIKNAGETTGYPNGAVQLYQSQFLNIHDVVFTDCFEYGVSLKYYNPLPPFHLEYANLSLDNTPKLFSDWNGVEVTDPNNP